MWSVWEEEVHLRNEELFNYVEGDRLAYNIPVQRTHLGVNHAVLPTWTELTDCVELRKWSNTLIFIRDWGDWVLLVIVLEAVSSNRVYKVGGGGLT